jgi:probable biosynthetic protein (TIGR04098 family)
MADTWNDFELLVQMPHMAPGEKLSEVEFLKQLAAWQWEAIARALKQRPPQLANAQGERLYGSVIDVELHLGAGHSMEHFGEDVRIHVRNRVRFYAKKFVEGLFLIDDRPIPDDEADAVSCREDLRRRGGSWACMTNAFIARGGSNVRLKVFRPVGVDHPDVPEMRETPLGIVEQGRAQSSGELAWAAGTPEAAIPLEARRTGERILYSIVPESDLNGASLVYFARYESMMNYGVRRFLCEHLDLPVSTELVSYLSTEHRNAYFFANAAPTDVVDVRVSAQVLPPGSFEPQAPAGAYRVPLKLLFRIDLYRCSDNVLMASSLVRTGLHVPGGAKAVLHEAERWLRRLG